MVPTLIMNYFELFGIPVSFKPDLVKLKKKYYELSFQYHPDQNTTKDILDQEDILDQSSDLNKAYYTLNDENKRFEYILKLHKVMPEEGKAQIPQTFLMEMMEINEEIMDLELEPDIERIDNLSKQTNLIESDLYKEIDSIISDYSQLNISPESLQKLVEFYLKKKYLLRIKQNILRFASS
jgi:molecular chaperone HscB